MLPCGGPVSLHRPLGHVSRYAPRGPAATHARRFASWSGFTRSRDRLWLGCTDPLRPRSGDGNGSRRPLPHPVAAPPAGHARALLGEDFWPYGFAPNRAAARQLITHGHIQLNGRACNIPSLLVRAGDTVTVKSRPRGLKLVKLYLQDNPPPVPDFLERTNMDPPEGRVLREPSRTDVDTRIQNIDEQLIIEFCSR